MKKLNVIITSVVCASLMAVSASAASDKCVSVYDSINKTTAAVNSINNPSCDIEAVLKSIISNCLNVQLPNAPEMEETPDQEQAPIIPDTSPEQDKLPGNNDQNSNISGSISEFERRVVELVNTERAKNGLSALTINKKLSDIAREKSRDMQKNGYFSHTSPTYGSPFEMLRRFGVSYNTAGENIAMGYSSPEAVVNGWMNSSGHRANILSRSFTEIGVGYVANGNYWTQLFIG